MNTYLKVSVIDHADDISLHTEGADLDKEADIRRSKPKQNYTEYHEEVRKR